MFAFILVLLAAWGASPAFAADPAPSYLAELQQSAKVRQLATSPVWLNLLHYKRHPLTGQVRSLADDPAFFAAADGARNAQAELDATLARFFEDISETPTTQSAQCRYRARFVWLSAQLGFDERLPRANCARFDTWRAAMNPQGLTLIYASAYLNSPASMYGHTMFRVDQAGQRPSTETLAYTLSYAADGDSNDGLGIGFSQRAHGPGPRPLLQHTVLPAGARVQRPGKPRHLGIPARPVCAGDRHGACARLELGPVRFDYFFFDENCSYHILAAGRGTPPLQLTDQFVWHTIPIDTVKAAMALPGLVKQVRYRPSQLSLLQARADTLKPLQPAMGQGTEPGHADAGDPKPTNPLTPRGRAGTGVFRPVSGIPAGGGRRGAKNGGRTLACPAFGTQQPSHSGPRHTTHARHAPRPGPRQRKAGAGIWPAQPAAVCGGGVAPRPA
ncbi:MAG: DUF4105 domain-containing protein [Burkholderiales bacterium]|nr:DUF4105 domain-containing protein [Burkholderiales bacterium]